MDITYFLLLNFIPPEILPLVNVFKYKNINNVVNFHCNKAAWIANKVMINSGIRLSDLNISFNSSYKIPHYYPKLGLVLNTSCDGWENVFNSISSKNVFRSPFNWFVVSNDMTTAVEILSQLPIEVDSDVILVNKGEGKLVNFFEAYNTGFYTGGRFIVKHIGFWNKTLHLLQTRRMDFSGVVLKGAVVVTQKVVNETFDEYVERSRLYKSDTLHKLKFFTLLKYLRDMYNFSYELRRVNSWGYLRNGSFDGMIGTLQRHETDIGCSPVFFRQERAKVLDATIEVWPSRPMFILRHPKHSGGYSTIYTRPLAGRVWAYIAALLATSVVVLSAMCRLRALKTDDDGDEDVSPSLALLVIWSAICQQGYSLSRSSTSIKLVIFSTFVFAVTIYQYYNATVVSTLLREPPKNIRTPRDLLRSSLKAGVHDVLYNKDFFKRTTDPIALEMYSKKIVTATDYNFFTLEQGMAMVKRGGFAFLVDSAIAYAVMKNTFNEPELCEAHEIALYPPQNMASVVKKGSPYREVIAYGLRKTFESGLMQRIRSIWDEPRPACVRTPDSSLISVSLMEFSSALVVLAVGMATSCMILFAEIFLHSGTVDRLLARIRVRLRGKKQLVFPNELVGMREYTKAGINRYNNRGKQIKRKC